MSARQERRFGAAILLASALLSAAFIARSAFRVGSTVYFSLFDDAMISMRYARNLADGSGLVWNPGEAPVEGYTNLLWTLWMSVLHVVGLPERLIALGVMLSGAGLLLATVALAGALSRRLSPDRGARLLAMLATALCYPLTYWTLRGMEVGLLACLTTGAVLLALRLLDEGRRVDHALLALVVVAAVLTRTDAAILMGTIGIYLIWASPAGARVVNAASALVPLGATVVAHTAFRIAYYGDALPNTYYLKLGGVPLGQRLGRGTTALLNVELAYFLLPVLLGGAAFLAGSRDFRRRAALPALVAGAACAYSLYVGGDAWEWMAYPNRYVASIAPLVFVLGGVGLGTILTRPELRTAFWAVAGATTVVAIALGLAAGASFQHDGVPDGVGRVQVFVLLLVAAAVVGSRTLLRRWSIQGPAVGALAATVAVLAVNADGLDGWARHNGWHMADDAQATRTGIALARSSAPTTSVAVVWAGAIPYFSHLHAVDLLGKSDPRIARLQPRTTFLPGHNKWDYRYSIGTLRPDVVVDLWRPTTADRTAMATWGYVRLAPNVYVAAASTRVDRGRLERGL